MSSSTTPTSSRSSSRSSSSSSSGGKTGAKPTSTSKSDHTHTPQLNIHNISGGSNSSNNSGNNNQSKSSLLASKYDPEATESIDVVDLDDDDDDDDNSSGPPAYNPSATTAGSVDGNEELQREEEMYTRGRSRSRSVCKDESDPNSPNFVPPQPSSPSGGSSRSSSGEKERSGPLNSREHQALQKGLEEANAKLEKNPKSAREEELERIDAENEKREREAAGQRESSTDRNSHSQLPPTPPMLSTEQNLKKIKILLLGDSGAGKSSLILRWTMDQFNPTLIGTVGVNFKTKRVQCEGELLAVQVWDTAGQAQFHKITTSYYKGAQGIFLIFDVSDKKSFENIEYWIKNIKQYATETVSVVLVGNKSDLRLHPEMGPKCCDLKAAKDLADKHGVTYHEASAKLEDGAINNVDFAFMSLVKKALGREKSQAVAGGHAAAKQSMNDKDKEKDKDKCTVS